MRVASNGYRTLIRDSVMVTENLTEDFHLKPLPVHYYIESYPLSIPDDSNC